MAEVTEERGFDVVIEAAGAPRAMVSALEVAGPGARVVYVGINVGGTATAQMGLVQSNALQLRGVIGSSLTWPKTIRFLASGIVDPTPIVSATFPLASAVGALAVARDAASNVKVHIETRA